MELFLTSFKLWAIAVALSMLSACAAALSIAPNGSQALPEPPAGAIEVEEDFYMVNIGVGEDGCRQYSAWSATRPVLTAVYYRQEDGTFTLFRSKVACSREFNPAD